MKFIKQFVITGALVLGVTFGAGAQQGVSLPFIGYGGSGPIPGWNGFLQIQPQSTNSYGATNIFAKGSYITNMLVTLTNPANGLVITGYQSVTLPNWVTNTSAIQDVTLWANRDGTAPIATIGVDIYGAQSNFTNTIVFNFATGPTPDGNVDTQAQNLWTFSLVGNGTNDVILSTNIPTALLQGNRKLRLTSVNETTSGASTGTNGFVNNVWLSGFKSAGAE